ncbi:MAG: type II and III secretion system protein [Bryobacteraceae bacterium]
MRRVLLTCAAALGLLAEDPFPFLKQDARAAAKKGDVVNAYLLYSQAAANNPKDKAAWARAFALQTRALSASKLVAPGADPVEPIATDPLDPSDWVEARKARAPLRLEAKPGPQNFQVRATAKPLIEQVLKAFGIEPIFDGDFPDTGAPIRFEMKTVEFLEAAEALEAATATFLVPISEKLALVAKDTQQKRQELEHTMALAVPLPQATSVQEAQELARAIQQLMEIQKFGVDSANRVAIIRDRESKVLPAARLFNDVLRYRGQVMLDIELLESTETNSLDLGVQLPTRFPMFLLNEVFNTKPSIAGVTNLVKFAGGKTLIGVGLADSQLIASFSKGSTRSLRQAEVRGVEGQAINFHIGDKYPVLTAGYFGATPQAGQTAYRPPPTFNFEDIGVVLKVTPKIHSSTEVTLEMEAEYKVITGAALNGIPIIANRKMTSSIRLKMGESAVVAGLLRVSEARTLTGLAGLMRIPVLGALFRTDSRSRDYGQTLFVVTPHILSAPPADRAGTEVFTGPEGRLRIPL